MALPTAATLALADDAQHDPVWAAARDALPCPAKGMPTAEELAGFEEIIADYHAGHAQLLSRAEVLATIEEMRREQDE
jgi:hypothetical protein